MRTARGARMWSILGASLIATVLPFVAVAETSDSRARAITGGSVEAITGGSVEAITGGSVEAITGGSVEAITGGSVEAITGGSVEAITGGSVEAITGGSMFAITGGSVEAITGGSVEAITGGSVEAITGGSAYAITGGSGQVWYGESLVLSGPVESIDRARGIFTSVGQNVLAARGMLDSLSIGAFVSVRGTIAGAGWIYADDVALSREQYVPGATEVFVTGIPSSVDLSLGTATIGGLTVDYTPSLGGSGFGGLGDAITVIGTQPARGGVMLSDRIFDKTNLILGN